MIVYTTLRAGVTFSQLEMLGKIYNVSLRYALVNSDNENEMKVLFWIAKSNRLLPQFRAKEAIENIYQGLIALENHKELIK